MEIISKISKGTVMDQVYIPKKRLGMPAGSYVIVKQLETKPKQEIKPFYLNIKKLEPIKVEIIKEIFEMIEAKIKNENIIITGSFLEKGFNFNDIDIIIIKKEKTDEKLLIRLLEDNIGIKTHLIILSNKALIKGLATDPLYRLMLSKAISKKRFLYKKAKKINYKILDLHILKSRPLIENFEFLTGKQKYEMLRNLIAINEFIDNRDIKKEKIDNIIRKDFGEIRKIKDNLIIDDFRVKYKKIYIKTQNKILEGIKNEPK